MCRFAIAGKITLMAMLPLFCSCIKAPFEVNLNEKIEVTEKTIADIREQIYDALSEIDFSKPASCPEDEVRAAYKIWLRQQFNKGYLKKDIISPLEYGASGLSAHPAIATCRHLDFAKEYKDAQEKRLKKAKREAIIFRLNSIRDIISSNKCTDNFIDLSKEKITINDIGLHISQNSLSVTAPKYKLYTSDEELRKEELEELNAETELVANNTLYFIAQTKPIKPHSTGVFPVELEPDGQKFSDAEVPIVALNGSVVAIPNLMASEPEIITRAGDEYYVVPSGMLSLRLTLKVSVSFSLADALCAYDQFKESIKKEEEGRKKGE